MSEPAEMSHVAKPTAERRRRTTRRRSTPTVTLAEPRGLCWGAERAVRFVERALDLHGSTVYVRREIAHSGELVRHLERLGARFVDSEREIPDGAVCVFSVHGVSPAVRAEAERRSLRVIDATCPLVAGLHQQVSQVAAAGRTVLLIGDAEHEELQGLRGEAPNRTVVVTSVADVADLAIPVDTPLAYLTQTTLSQDQTAEIVEAVRARFTDLVALATDSVCQASQQRENGVKSLSSRCDVVLVVGPADSTETARLLEVAGHAGARAHLVPEGDQVRADWLTGATSVGVTSADTPDSVVDEVLDQLDELGFKHVWVDRTALADIPPLDPGRLPAQSSPAPAQSPAPAPRAAQQPAVPAVPPVVLSAQPTRPVFPGQPALSAK
ncbi:4-hydroxy-3-methylbut-2-enyl diphosphate reductase [Goodfellowiella coeruleoviolacea]|nr:4-hydroxy-3-methylbut-2-enyl diphosphate reductase [Goodfellowiella coeruleoviolacea]